MTGAELTGKRICAVIVAAGAGERYGSDKIFQDMLGRPLLAYTVEPFECSDLIDEIVLVVAANRVQKARRLVVTEDWLKVHTVCAGGARRRDSVLKGLQRLKGCDFVLVHDGARPLVTEELIAAGLQAAQITGAAVPGVPVKDTIKEVDGEGRVRYTLDRSVLVATQTPQVFAYDLLWRAYRDAGDEDFTDDAAAVERLGCPVVVFPGSGLNLKVTTIGDEVLAKVGLVVPKSAFRQLERRECE